MRFKSKNRKGFKVFAVTGTNSVSFAIDPESADCQGLLGFSVERFDPEKNERYFLYGFKVFETLIPNPTPDTTVSTFDHPVQSFVWDDFTLEPESTYTYWFHPVTGSPKNQKHAKPIKIEIKTEALFSREEHDVFFNRGVASSQAYARRFANKNPDQLDEPLKSEAMEWLSRKLDDAIIKFIRSARKGDTVLGCFYEFRYLPVLQEIKKAIDKGVNFRIIIDAKENGKNGEEDFPKDENLKAIRKAKISLKNIVKREARKSNIQHNKFMVLLRGKKQTPKEVWTGSTNISEGGIIGQTNVGHWVRNKDVASKFREYWDLLSSDPGGKTGDSRSEVLKKNREFRKTVSGIEPDIKKEDIDKIKIGCTTVFSPRDGIEMLNTYATMLDQAVKSSHITLAFGINKTFKELLKGNTNSNHIVFILLEKKDKPGKNDKDAFIRLNAGNNVYQAHGSYLSDPLYQWTREVNNKILKFNFHVSYIHSKFMLIDPLSNEPIVVTGSANFSSASTKDNDENMLIIRGDKRVADIYFTEFNRLFNHYYFRSVIQNLKDQGKPTETASIFLREDDSWITKYKKGSLRFKRIALFRDMNP